jgi:hypothetical protein
MGNGVNNMETRGEAAKSRAYELQDKRETLLLEMLRLTKGADITDTEIRKDSHLLEAVDRYTDMVEKRELALDAFKEANARWRELPESERALPDLEEAESRLKSAAAQIAELDKAYEEVLGQYRERFKNDLKLIRHGRLMAQVYQNETGAEDPIYVNKKQ